MSAFRLHWISHNATVSTYVAQSSLPRGWDLVSAVFAQHTILLVELGERILSLVLVLEHTLRKCVRMKRMERRPTEVVD